MYGYQPLLSTPKTRRGKRLVALDPATVAALKENRRRQKEERLAGGAAWKDSGFVFTREDGEPYHPGAGEQALCAGGQERGSSPHPPA